MRKLKKSTKLAAVGTVALLALSGCAISSDSSGDEEGTTTLTFWSYYQGTQADWLSAQVDEFEANNPDIKINVIETVGNQHDQKLLASVATGATPDLFINNIVVDFQTLVSGNVMADLTPYWEEYADKDVYPEGTAWESDDKVYNLLPFTNLLGMYYNQDILSEYGITEPPQTLDELEEAMATVTADGTYEGIALSGAPSVEGAWLFAPQLLGEGVDYCNFEGPKVDAAFERLSGWSTNGYIPLASATWDQNASWQQFMTGKYAFAFNGNWQLGNVQEATFEYGTAPYPAPKGGKSQVFPGGEGFAIGAESKNADLAWQFLEEAVLSADASENMFTASGSIPVRSDLADASVLKDDEFVQPFVAAAGDSATWPNNENTAQMQSSLGEAVSAVISGQQNGAQGAESAIADIEAAVEDGGGSC